MLPSQEPAQLTCSTTAVAVRVSGSVIRTLTRESQPSASAISTV